MCGCVSRHEQGGQGGLEELLPPIGFHIFDELPPAVLPQCAPTHGLGCALTSAGLSRKTASFLQARTKPS